MLVTYTVYVKSGSEVCYALHILTEDIHICLGVKGQCQNTSVKMTTKVLGIRVKQQQKT